MQHGMEKKERKKETKYVHTTISNDGCNEQANCGTSNKFVSSI